MARRRYRFDKVDIASSGERSASWGFAGSAVTGTEHAFVVTDGNYRQRDHWEFVARVPKEAGGRIEVRPALLPNDRAWADLDRRSLTFNRATKSRYRGLRYCQVALADPSGRRPAFRRSHRAVTWMPAAQRMSTPAEWMTATCRRTSCAPSRLSWAAT